MRENRRHKTTPSLTKKTAGKKCICLTARDWNLSLRCINTKYINRVRKRFILRIEVSHVCSMREAQLCNSEYSCSTIRSTDMKDIKTPNSLSHLTYKYTIKNNYQLYKPESSSTNTFLNSIATFQKKKMKMEFNKTHTLYAQVRLLDNCSACTRTKSSTKELQNHPIYRKKKPSNFPKRP